jgi:hypothetical protein
MHVLVSLSLQNKIKSVYGADQEFWHELVDDNRVVPQFRITSCAYAGLKHVHWKLSLWLTHCEKCLQNLGAPVAHMGLSWFFGMNSNPFSATASKCGGKMEVLKAHPHCLLSANIIFLYIYIYIYIYEELKEFKV